MTQQQDPPTVDLVGTIPGMERGTADEIREGFWVATPTGSLYRVDFRFGRVPKGYMSFKRSDGWVTTWPTDEPVSFVRDDGRVIRPAREIWDGAMILGKGNHVIFPEPLTVAQRRQVMKADDTVTVEYTNRQTDTFRLNEAVMFTPPARQRPVIGTGATLHMPDDAMGYVVREISRSGGQCQISRLPDPDSFTNTRPGEDFPRIEHVYTPEEISHAAIPPAKTWETARRHKDGKWRVGTQLITFDRAYYLRDYSA